MKLKKIGGLLAAIALVSACVDVDEQLGDNLIPGNQDYTFYTTTIDIDDVEMMQADSLSGYNLYRITFGAIRDDGLFGLTKRTSAFYIVPVADTLDFGPPGTQQFIKFHLSAPLDTISCANPNQANILQNVNVFALEEPMNMSQGAPELKYDTRGFVDFNLSRSPIAAK